jgi:hypothetical protein
MCRRMSYSTAGVRIEKYVSTRSDRRDSACSAASCAIGVILIITGIVFIWWADLDRLQKAQASAVRDQSELWDNTHREPWQATQVCGSTSIKQFNFCCYLF